MLTLFTGATLIDGTGSPPRPGATVAVEDGRIAAVGSLADFGSRAREAAIVDLAGRFLLPGFVNAHDHVTNKRVRGTRAEKAKASSEALAVLGVRNALVNLREGFTTIRDVGARGGVSRVVKAAIGDGRIFGPTMVLSPRGLTVTAGYAYQNAYEVDTETEARKAAGQLVKDGTDWVKCMASIEWEKAQGEPVSAVNMSRELMRAAFDVAHHHGKPCLAHAVCDEAIENAVEAGVDSIEHGIMMSAATAATMAARGVFLVPTLSGYRQHCSDWGRGEGVIRHGHLLKQHHAAGFRNAVEAGVRYAYGSDTLGNLPEEVRLMQECGVSLDDCIVAVTRTGAELLRMDDRIGTVQAGKEADLTVLSSDPRQSAEAFADIHLVVKRGRVVDPAHITI